MAGNKWHPDAAITDIGYGMYFDSDKGKDLGTTSMILKRATPDAKEKMEYIMRFVLVDDDLREIRNIFRGILDEHDIDYEPDETRLVARRMRNEGSGFEAQLGEALSIADSRNAKRILQAFPDVYQKYSDMIAEEYGEEDTGDSSGFGLHTDRILGENPDMLRQD